MRTWFLDRRHLWYRGSVAIFVCIVILAWAFMLLRLRSIEAVHTQFSALHAENRDQLKSNAAKIADCEFRLDEIERVLFGDVIAKLAAAKPTPPPNRIELWQLNRDKELRELLRRLQLQRLDLENRVLRLEREIR